MATRISASSYLNTAPLVWSFLNGQNHGKVEIVLDNAPARSVELLSERRVDAALVPVFAYQSLDDVYIVPDVCVGARDRVRSVCLVTDGRELKDVTSVALDNSSRTSVALTKVIFREFLDLEPEWCPAEPDVNEMLSVSDCALLIGDPALRLVETDLRVFDLAKLWNGYTALGFVFAMWMTRERNSPIDFAAARNEGLAHIDEIVANYLPELAMSRDEIRAYLTQNISYRVDDEMRQGMELFFKLAHKHKLFTTERKTMFAS